MAIHEVLNAIRQALQEDESLGTRGNCRVTPVELAKVARKKDKKIGINFLAAMGESADSRNHYALEISDGEESVIINMDPTAGYPEYIGPPEAAPGLLRQMKKVKKII